MSKRRRLLRQTLVLCSVPVVIVAAWILYTRGQRDAPYVAGEETEGITRSLNRQTAGRAGGIRFTEVTDAAGIDFRHFPFARTAQLPEDMGCGVAWADYDGDGWKDLFFVNVSAPVGVPDEEMGRSTATDRLYRNRGDGTFEDVTHAAGLDIPHRGMGAVWGDMDADGDTDLFVTSWGRNHLWENRGDGSFREVGEARGISGDGFWAGASWSDYDRDGDLDLYVTGYVQYRPEKDDPATRAGGNNEFPFTLNPSSYPAHPNRLYVNSGDGHFSERSAETGVLDANGKGMGAAWADFDEDGWPDLYVANDVSDNSLYRNRGDGFFENISYEAAVADYRGAMGIAVGDWDGDLDLDLFITHWIAQENALYSNQLADRVGTSGEGTLRFVDEADSHGLGQIALDLIGWGTDFQDLDADGWLDLFVANGSTFQDREDLSRLIPMHSHLYRNAGGTRGFFEIGEEAGIRTDPPGVERGAAFADYDNDGDMDLAVCRVGGRGRLLRNESRGGHWTILRLRATAGHPDALGARVVAKAGDRHFLREVGAGASYLSQSDRDVHIGLGEADRIETLSIRWPGGGVDEWQDLDADRAWLVREGARPQPLESYGSGARRAFTRQGASEHAVVSDSSTHLSRDEIREFWNLNRKARGELAAQQWSEATETLRAMLALDPDHLDSLYNLGNCLLEQEQYAEALRNWQRLVSVNPASSRGWGQIGVLHALPDAGDLFDLEAAALAFSRAHDLNPEQSGPVILWGEAALAAGDTRLAERLFADARGMSDTATSAYFLGAYLVWKRGDATQAGELWKQTLASLQIETPLAAASQEGDTKDPALVESRRRAAGRRLFAGCLQELEGGTGDLDPEAAFACVDQRLAELRGTS